MEKKKNLPADQATLLIVEDDVQLRQAIARRFSKTGSP